MAEEIGSGYRGIERAIFGYSDFQAFHKSQTLSSFVDFVEKMGNSVIGKSMSSAIEVSSC